nr:hypothetical protein [Embleya scabrispora]
MRRGEQRVDLFAHHVGFDAGEAEGRFLDERFEASDLTVAYVALTSHAHVDECFDLVGFDAQSAARHDPFGICPRLQPSLDHAGLVVAEHVGHAFEFEESVESHRDEQVRGALPPLRSALLCDGGGVRLHKGQHMGAVAVVCLIEAEETLGQGGAQLPLCVLQPAEPGGVDPEFVCGLGQCQPGQGPQLLDQFAEFDPSDGRGRRLGVRHVRQCGGCEGSATTRAGRNLSVRVAVTAMEEHSGRITFRVGSLTTGDTRPCVLRRMDRREIDPFPQHRSRATVEPLHHVRCQIRPGAGHARPGRT